MVKLNVFQMFRVDAAHVYVEVGCGLDAAANWTVNGKIRFHLINTSQVVVL